MSRRTWRAPLLFVAVIVISAVNTAVQLWAVTE